jgi:transposase
MKYFAGLDVSLAETAICVVDEDGIVVTEGKAASEPDDLVRWLVATGLTITRVGLEAGPLSPWLHTELRATGLPAICIETRRMKGATAAMAVKTDRNDARAIAHAMRVGWFTVVHVKTAESQELRLLLNNRRTLLEKRVAIDNEIRGTLKAFGLKLGAVTVAAFEVRVLELLAKRSRLLAMVRPMLAARAALRQQCDVLHRMVLKAVRASAVCRRLLSVPGVGPIVALTYATGVDDPARFIHSRDIGPHFGLTPRKYASGEIDRNGSITKAGDGAVREVLVQAALTLLTRVQRWSALKAWGMAVAKRRGPRRAIVAVARKLAIVMHRMWADSTMFNWKRETVALA